MSKKAKIQKTLLESERPVTNQSEDKFDFKDRIAKKIYSFLQENNILPINIAITGEWGIGKSSVINLLREEIKKGSSKNLLVYFEPLVEGKLEIFEMLELFYSQLYRNIKDDSIKNVIKKSLQSLLALAKFKASFKFHGAEIEKDIGATIEEWCEIWSSDQPPLFYEQAKILNELLEKSGFKLYVIIDEVDRLTADRMLNFLLFARVLELFNNLVCIVGIDYKQAANKLINEGHLGLCDYEAARAYLDKLFQYNFHVSIKDDKKYSYVKEQLQNIDKEEFIINCLSSEEYDIALDFEKIVSYLHTPRQIKKWLITVKLNYALIKYSTNILAFLGFLAVTVKHPILLENFDKYGLKFLFSDYPVKNHMKEHYGIECKALSRDNCLLLLMGVLNTEIKSAIEESKQLQSFFHSFLKTSIEEYGQIEDFILKFLTDGEGVPRIIIEALIKGHINEEEFNSIYAFFNGSSNKILKTLIKNNGDELAADIANALKDYSLDLQDQPSFLLINQLAREKYDVNFGPANYARIIWYCLSHYNLSDIIAKADLFLSEAILSQILRDCGVDNQNGNYNFENFRLPEIENRFIKLIVKDGEEKKEIKRYISTWIQKVEEMLNDGKLHEQKSLLSVLFRFIQFERDICGGDKTKTLSDSLCAFLDNTSIAERDKVNTIELITHECYLHLNFFEQKKTILEALFNCNEKLIEKIRIFGVEKVIKYMDEFNEVVNKSCKL